MVIVLLLYKKRYEHKGCKKVPFMTVCVIAAFKFRSQKRGNVCQSKELGLS